MRLLVPLALLTTVPAIAWGQGATVCPESAPELFPLANSTSIPRNGIVRVLYRQPFNLQEHEAEDVIDVFDEAGLRLSGAAVLTNDAMDSGAEAIWRSAQILAENTTYTVEVREPIAEDPLTYSFTTGTLARDEAPPEFAGVSDVEIVDAVGDLDEPSYEVRVSFPSAEDDAGSGNVEYSVYQTDGPDWVRPVERRRVRCLGTSGVAAFIVPREDVERWACFQVRATDMFGSTEDNDEEACGIPEGPGVFRSICATAGSPRQGIPTAGVIALVLSAGLRRGRRPRP